MIILIIILFLYIFLFIFEVAQLGHTMMVTKQTVFMLTALFFILVIFLTIAVIAIAIFFQKLRKKIEEEIKAGEPNDNQPVAKMTVKKRKRENKYSKSAKRSDGEPKFYESPPMRDDQREILKMKSLQIQENQEDYDYNYDICSQDQVTQSTASSKVTCHAATMPRTSVNEESYIECIGDNLHPMTTFQSAGSSNKEPVPQLPRKSKCYAATMTRTSVNDDSYIECIRDNKTSQTITSVQGANVSPKREPVTQVQRKYKGHATTMPRGFERDDTDGERIGRMKPSHGATIHSHTSSPNKQVRGHGVKGAYRDNVTPQHVSRNAIFKNTNNHGVEEMYEVMENNNEIYENTAFDSKEDVYGNQEIIEQENMGRSLTNTVQLPQHSSNWDSQAARYHEDNYEEEVYENQEIVEQERRKSALRDGAQHLELYQNYISEEMYGNC